MTQQAKEAVPVPVDQVFVVVVPGFPAEGPVFLAPQGFGSYPKLFRTTSSAKTAMTQRARYGRGPGGLLKDAYIASAPVGEFTEVGP